VDCTTLRRWGGIPEAILQAAAEEQCELIVMGSRMVSGWKRLQLGRIANAVASKAQQPVLVVKTPPPGHHLPLWRRMLVATGGSPWSDIAVEHAITLAQTYQFEIVLLHVLPKRRRGRDLSTDEGTSLLALAEARAEAAGVPFHSVLMEGDVISTIIATATERECDGIILGSRGIGGWKRLMLGSISNAVAVKAVLPVLIVKRFLPL
jgi:nucleotide-binding universal stress UspA family protein